MPALEPSPAATESPPPTPPPAGTGRDRVPGRHGPFARAYVVVTLAILSLVTIVAFEAMAVSTAMPKVAVDLDALRSYGLAFSVMLTMQLLGIVLAGVWVDRSGPLWPIFSGQALLAGGAAICAVSVQFSVFLVGRAVMGLGGGFLLVTFFVVIGRVYPPAVRPRLFAMVSAAWILPAMAGPPIAAWITDTWTWRYVFGCVVVPTAVIALIMVTQVRFIAGIEAEVPSSRDRAAHRRAAWWGLAIAIGAGLFQWGTHEPALQWSSKLGLAFGGAVLLIFGVPRVFPVGTFRMFRGLPTLILVRLLLYTAFFGAVTYVPLMLVSQRNFTLARAGLILAIGSLGWALGAIWQSRARFDGHREALVTWGGIFITSGLVIMALVSGLHVTTYIMSAALILCGIGMGLGMATTSVLLLSLATPAEHGEASSALNVADALGSVIGIASAGAVFAAFHNPGPGRDGWVFALIWAALAGLAVIVSLGAHRIRRAH